MRVRLKAAVFIALPLTVVSVTSVVSGCATDTGPQAAAPSAPQPAGTGPTPPSNQDRGTPASPPTLPQQPPGLGPKTLAQIPADATQVVEAVGDGINSPTANVTLYQRTASGWQAGPTWPAHDARDGWAAHKRQGDLRTPIGVYGLTDAGGLLADPGSKLPYHQSSEFTVGGEGFEGEPLAGAFDYVIAINYNRKIGVSPLDDTYPLGYEAGTGVWLHVDHGGPTHGCVSIPRPDIVTLLRELDPARHPVIAMGDAASLAQ